MTKKEQKHHLLAQITLAIHNEPGAYQVQDGYHIFKMPGLTEFKIKTTIDPEEVKNQRLLEFYAKVSKSDAFKNVKGASQV